MNHIAEELLKDLRPILNKDNVMDLVINKPYEAWAITSDKGWVRFDLPELSEENLMSIARQIANYSDKSIDEINPILSGVIPNTNERVQVVIPPASKNISITIRKANPIVMTLEELEKNDAFRSVVFNKKNNDDDYLKDLLEKKDIISFLRESVKKKKNIVVSGATGSGKTTIMKSLIMEIPKNERLITIEDVHELNVSSHENIVHLLYSRGNEVGFNVDAKEALASCLRMRPSRILLAELRGDEAWEYIKSINTGHEGSITSMHANNAIESFEQLTAFIKDSSTGSHLDADYIKRRLFSTIDIVLHFEDRKLKEIYFEPEIKKSYLKGAE